MADLKKPPSHSNPHSNNVCTHVTSTPENVIVGISSVVAAAEPGVVGSINGAKYRLMSPAKLPISRSPCITIPPGLSPTSFLESPVLLSNVKVEPSPTTGSLLKPQLMQTSDRNLRLSSDKRCYGGNIVDGATFCNFDFKFPSGSNTAPGSSSGLSIPMGFNRNGLFRQSQDQQFPHTPSLATCESSSKELSISDPMVVHEAQACGSIDELNQGIQLSHTVIETSIIQVKDSTSSAAADKTADDGYNWRKYGQKLVKGSEFPRSYYKCTHSNCEVKKIFERSPSGLITEIFYKGAHDHPKPQAARRHNSGAVVPIQGEKFDKDTTFPGQEELNPNNMDPNAPLVLSPPQLNDGSGSQFQVTNDDIDEDDPFLKRRRMEDFVDVMPVVKPIREPRVVVQTVSEVDILDDGYRWRKYGQKVVRGNPNPRSYYKCTYSGCPVRKHVERASHDPKAVITTYEGKHNHDVPTARNSNPNFSGTTMFSGISKLGPEESNAISLDLGVSLKNISEGKMDVHTHDLDAEAAQIQIARRNSSGTEVQPSQTPGCYGVVNGGLNMYGNQENRVEGHSFQAPPIHPSNPCPQNLGRILMGP